MLSSPESIHDIAPEQAHALIFAQLFPAIEAEGTTRDILCQAASAVGWAAAILPPHLGPMLNEAQACLSLLACFSKGDDMNDDDSQLDRIRCAVEAGHYDATNNATEDVRLLLAHIDELEDRLTEMREANCLRCRHPAIGAHSHTCRI